MSERGRRVMRWLRRACFAFAGAFLTSSVVLLLTDRPRLANEWPWFAAIIAGATILGIVFAIAGTPAVAQFADGEPTMDTARRLAREGKRIQATRMVRQVTGMSLEESLALVKQLERPDR